MPGSRTSPRIAQGICGVAKELTRTASKSAIKLTASTASGRLFKWVAWFTGSKNAMKGLGFFVGGPLLDRLGFQAALWTTAGLIGLRLVDVVGFVPPLMGKRKTSKSTKEGRCAGVPVRLGLDLHDG